MGGSAVRLTKSGATERLSGEHRSASADQQLPSGNAEYLSLRRRGAAPSHDAIPYLYKHTHPLRRESLKHLHAATTMERKRP